MARCLTILLFVLLIAPAGVMAQYNETFSTPEKGYLVNKLNDFSGVNWNLSGWSADSTTGTIAGRDAGDYFKTNSAGKLEAIDLDHEVYWESPLLLINAAGSVSFSVDLTWTGFDRDINSNPALSGPYGTIASLDAIKVQYSINGGAFTTIPNLVGGAINTTVGYNSANANGNSSSITVNKSGIIGNNLRIRIVVNINSNEEKVTIDNVSVPWAGVSVACTLPQAAPADVVVTNSICNASCTVTGGTIAAPAGTQCPTGFSLQYQVNGGNWSSTLPTYAIEGPAQTIKTRCSCNLDVNAAGPVSAGVTTVPGNCNVQVTWLGITTDWNSPSNWSTGLVPTACSKVIINTIGVPNKPTITGTNNTCFTLTLQNGATVNIGKDAKLIITGK